MPFRRVAFFIKCRARGCGICSCSGGRPQLFREKCLNFVCRCPQKGRAHRSRQKSREVSEFCLPLPSKRACAPIEADKNREKCLIFVYRILQKGRARPIFTAPYPNAAAHHRCIQKHWILQKKEPPKIGRFLRCAAFIFFSVIRS